MILPSLSINKKRKIKMKKNFLQVLVICAPLALLPTNQTFAQTCNPPCNPGNSCLYDQNNTPECYQTCQGSYYCWQSGTCCPGGDNPQGCCQAGMTCDGNGGCSYTKRTKSKANKKSKVKASTVKLKQE